VISLRRKLETSLIPIYPPMRASSVILSVVVLGLLHSTLASPFWSKPIPQTVATLTGFGGPLHARQVMQSLSQP